jgi:hypothetical protein
MNDFRPFPKMARLSREIIVTEKIDGTNAQICIDAIELDEQNIPAGSIIFERDGAAYAMRVGSRRRWITPSDDNFGFAAWAWDNVKELGKLGPGVHFGEWWGQGIQRNYGMDKKVFSLFNVDRWGHTRPECCELVPVLYRGMFCEPVIYDCLDKLEMYGSEASHGFMDPEGIIVWHTAANIGFKKTIKDDDVPKEVAKLRARAEEVAQKVAQKVRHMTLETN